MWRTNNNIALRTLVWLAALALPVQAIPASSCGCSRGVSGCQAGQRGQCCCSADTVQQGACCCGRTKTESGPSCCKRAVTSRDSGCKCGVNCQCGKAQQPPPAAPAPTENSPAEKITCEMALAPFATVGSQTIATPSGDTQPLESDARTAQEHCVCLCRLTL